MTAFGSYVTGPVELGGQGGNFIAYFGRMRAYFSRIHSITLWPTPSPHIFPNLPLSLYITIYGQKIHSKVVS